MDFVFLRTGSAVAALLLTLTLAHTAPAQDNRAALDALMQWIATPTGDRPNLGDQPFAKTALSKQDSQAAREILWEYRAKSLKQSRAEEFAKKVVTFDGKEMKYEFRTFGKAPAGGHSLFISMHGGGNAPAKVNDQQWKNQIRLYEPKEGIYLAPRAPTDTWNLWHEKHIDPMFDQLIADFVVFEGINPNRVYLMGYSAGGDGVYQLAPRMADRFAAAAMMAGHPNETKPAGLRNLPFTLHMGGNDAAYRRNEIAAEWKEALAKLHEADPDGYTHEVIIHEGKGHWMNREDAVAVPWMAKFDRNPWPKKIVWLQDDVTHPRFYWLAVENEKAGQLIEAAVDGQTIQLSIKDGTADGLTLLLSDVLLDLDQPVKIMQGETVLFEGIVARTIDASASTLVHRADPASATSAILHLKGGPAQSQ
ncbi:MAG: dienelactone hydrolase family protein [Verrucomicrobiales bacterium]